MKSPSPKLWWLTKKTGVSSIFPSLSGAPQIFSLQKSVEAKIEIGLVPIGRGVSGFSTKSQILQLFYEGPHVLVHLLKSLTAYNVISSSSLFSDNVQLDFYISFPLCKIQQPVLLQIHHKKLGPSGMRLFRPMYRGQRYIRKKLSNADKLALVKLSAKLSISKNWKFEIIEKLSISENA